MVQETFLIVIRATSRYEPRSLVRTYLYGIALKLLSEERRRQEKDPPAPESSPEPMADDASETVLWVRRALGQLEAMGDEISFIQSVRAEQFVNVDFTFFASDPECTR